MEQNRIYTSSYKLFLPEMGVPVQISNGRPKWRIPYRLVESIPEMYPRWDTMKLPVGRFREIYWAGLDRLGVDWFRRRFKGISDAHDGRPVVLLCFEKDTEDCHRGDFAIWWRRETGEVVEEATLEPPLF